MVSRFWKPSLITVCITLSFITTIGETKNAGTSRFPLGMNWELRTFSPFARLMDAATNRPTVLATLFVRLILEARVHSLPAPSQQLRLCFNPRQIIGLQSPGNSQTRRVKRTTFTYRPRSQSLSTRPRGPTNLTTTTTFVNLRKALSLQP